MKVIKSTNNILKIFSSTFWIFNRVVFTLILNLVVIGILSRQLGPKEFGLVALAGVFIQFLTFLGSQGIPEYVIFDPVDNERDERINAAFWLDIVFGFCTFLICIAIIPLFVHIYPYEQLSLIVFLLALKFPFEAICRVPDALFKKQLNFKVIEIRDALIQLFVGLGGIVMALNNFGVWSLVVPSVFASPIRAIIIFRFTYWRPKLYLGISYWREIFKYSRNIIGSTLTSFIISNGDTLLIGKLLGPNLLGIYNIAWRSANLVNRSMLQISNKLTLPVLAKSEGDIAKLLISFRKMVCIIGLAAFPPIVALFVVADVFILVVYGDKWVGAILPFRILLIYALRFSVSSPVGSVFKAVGKPQIDFKIGVYIIPFYLIGIYLGSSYGIVGVATGVTIVRTLSGVISYYFVAKVLKKSFLAVIRPILQPLLLSIFLGIILSLVRLVLCFIGLNEPLTILLISMLVGIIVFWLLLRNIFRSLSLEILNYLTHIIPTKTFILLSKLLKQN